jgi:hypothetical protein
MKTFAAVATLALISSVSADVSPSVHGSIVEAACNQNELIFKVLPILSSPNFKACQSESGYTFYPFKGVPTPEQEAKLCATETCKNLLKEVQKKNLPSCEISYDGQTYNPKELIDKYSTKCLSPIPFLYEEACNTADLASKLLPVFLFNGNVKKCEREAGYTFYPFNGIPTAEQVAKMCQTQPCKELLRTVQKKNLPSCEISYDGQVFNPKEVVEKLSGCL